MPLVKDGDNSAVTETWGTYTALYALVHTVYSFLYYNACYKSLLACQGSNHEPQNVMCVFLFLVFLLGEQGSLVIADRRKLIFRGKWELSAA